MPDDPVAITRASYDAEAYFGWVDSPRSRAGETVLNQNIEVEDIFTRTQRLIECNGRSVRWVRLNENHVGTEFVSDAAQHADEARCNSATPVFLSHGEIVDVHFTALLFELRKHVGDKSAHDRASFVVRRENDHVGAVE